ncbi:uncharacterized protein LOC143180819 [Calliopsis andreniformis]|uniref:uncharacterized protein LOC143180819 n=1 Tax=Calliopsis andreniformis TaxID=337506 RepID=UPI003FCE00AE
MVDLLGKDKGNISLPVRLQPSEDEDEKNRPTIINMQRAFYTIKIADIQNRIKRLEDRNDELSEEIEVVNEQSSTVDAETAEEIANLYKQVYSQNDYAENLKNQIDTLENNRIEDKRKHEEKIESINLRYKIKKLELVSQIKTLSAKINALEDFKKTQTALEEKYKMNHESMQVNEEQVKEVLKIISRKYEFDKEILKNEMYGHLLDLAARFQIETNKRINLPDKRLMRENILLKNELAQMFKEISIKKETEADLKTLAIKYKKNMNDQYLNTRRNIVTIKIQDTVLRSLKKKFTKAHEYASVIKVCNSTVEKWMMFIDKLRQKKYRNNSQLSKLKTLVHKKRTQMGIAKYMLRKIECKIKAVVETLYDLKYIVACMFKNSINVRGLGYTETLLFLQQTLVKGQVKVQCGVVRSVETISGEIKLDADSLKDVPEEIEVLTVSEEREPSDKTILDRLMLVKEPDKEKLTKSTVSEDEFEDTTRFEHLESYELIEDWAEYDSEDESLFDLNEE